MDWSHKKMCISPASPSLAMDSFNNRSFSGVQPPSKKTECGVDRLSDLPEPLLHHIFSFIPTNEVVSAMQNLSKKWNQFCGTLPDLFFNVKEKWDVDFMNYLLIDNYDRGDVGFHCTPDYVDKVLYSRGQSGIALRKFRLRWPMFKLEFGIKSIDERKLLKKWINVALNQHVQEIDIFLGMVRNNSFTIPERVFSSESSVRVIKLEVMNHQSHLLVPRSILSAPNLVTLELVKIKLPKGNSKGELVFNCPALEALILRHCNHRHLKVLNFSVARLKKLMIDNRGNHRSTSNPKCKLGSADYLGDCKLEMNAPSLSTFVCKGNLYKDWSFGKFEALNEVDISLKSGFIIASPEVLTNAGNETKSEHSYALKLLRCVSSASALSLGELEIYSEVPDTLEDLLTPYTNLKKLEIKACFLHGSSLAWLASIVCRCTNIETLVLHVTQRWMREKEEPALPLCPLNHCKYVVVKGLKGHSNELELLRFLFNNAVNLESLIIIVIGPNHFFTERDGFRKFRGKLMTISLQFPNVKVAFRVYESYAPQFFSDFNPF